MQDFQDIVEKAMEKAMRIFQGDLRQELKDQGHYNTGKLHDSIEYKIKSSGDTVIAEVECEDYGLALEFGVRPGRIPFSGIGGGGTSQYIEGLVTYFRQKGLQGRAAISAAFATAHTQARTGMPTPGSYKFSRNGRRTGWASETLERDLEIIGSILEETSGAALEIDFLPGAEIQTETITIFT